MFLFNDGLSLMNFGVVSAMSPIKMKVSDT